MVGDFCNVNYFGRSSPRKFARYNPKMDLGLCYEGKPVSPEDSLEGLVCLNSLFFSDMILIVFVIKSLTSVLMQSLKILTKTCYTNILCEICCNP